jgi:pyruvate,water dikinase
LDKKGFNVPIAVVLATGFFHPWMAQLKATPAWETFTHTADDGMLAAAKAVKHNALKLNFSENQQQILAEVRQGLQIEAGMLMAVRSSSPEEDLEDASFAGIYETVLGVLQAFMRPCWA